MYSIQPLLAADLASYLGRWCLASSNDQATPNPSARSAERSSSLGLLAARTVDSSIHHLRIEESLSASIAPSQEARPAGLAYEARLSLKALSIPWPSPTG